MIRKIKGTGGISQETKPLLFELRFAAELHRLGLSAHYEYKTGINGSTVDFRIDDGFSWLIELVSIQTSDAVKCATKQTGPIWETNLSSNAEDIKQSVEGETILVQQKIGEKVYSNDIPIKFPPISNNVFSLILVDMRGYLSGVSNGGDANSYRVIAYGISGLERENEWMALYWKDRNGKLVPVKGLFDENNPLRAAKTLQERIHFLGFVSEKEYRQGKLLDQILYLANPTLFDTPVNESAKAIYNKMPFRRELANVV